VLNVYYDRNLLTIDFHRNGQSGAEDGEYTGLYGQTLAQYGYTWPANYRWMRSSSPFEGQSLTFLDSFIFDDLTDYGSATYINVYARSLQTGATIKHYKEELNGTWTEANTLSTGGGNFTFTNKYTGFTVSHYRTISSGPWTSTSPGQSVDYDTILQVRHSRNSYILSFYNYNSYAKTETFKYEAPLSGQTAYVPPRPSGIPSTFVFQGWCKDTAYTEPFNFSTEKMPASNLVIYAKWAPPTLSGQAYLNPEGTEGPVSFPVIYDQPIDRSTLPTVQDHTGTVIVPGNGVDFVTVP
jgi:uncharacterized repeat protein (TIGR02543 family)